MCTGLVPTPPAARGSTARARCLGLVVYLLFADTVADFPSRLARSVSTSTNVSTVGSRRICRFVITSAVSGSYSVTTGSLFSRLVLVPPAVSCACRRRYLGSDFSTQVAAIGTRSRTAKNSVALYGSLPSITMKGEPTLSPPKKDSC